MGSSEHCRPLKVLIVGAGIGGLTAGIGLRRQGHEVTVRGQFGTKMDDIRWLTDVRYLSNRSFPTKQEQPSTWHLIAMESYDGWVSMLKLLAPIHSML